MWGGHTCRREPTEAPDPQARRTSLAGDPGRTQRALVNAAWLLVTVGQMSALLPLSFDGPFP